MTILKANQFYEMSKADAGGPFQFNFDSETFEELEAPPKVVECKKKICDILLFGLGVMNEHRVEDFLAEFKEILEGIKPEDAAALMKLSLQDEKK